MIQTRASWPTVLAALLVGMASTTPSCHGFTSATTTNNPGATRHEGPTTTPSQPQALPLWRSRLAAATTNGEIGDDCVKTADVLSLDSIRSSLIRQEETIIFALIERAQYRQNPKVYQKGGLGRTVPPPGALVGDDEELSFLEYMLTGTEALHSAIRRYTSPEEHAFFPDRLSPDLVLEDLEYPDGLLSSEGGASEVNFNPILLRKYTEVIVPAISVPGDDEQHGSTGLADIAVLQALSRRVHYGKFVAESKYQGDPEGYQKLVDAGDAEGVMELLTNEAVEAKVLRRARLKAATYGMEPLLAELPPLADSSGKTREETAIVAAAAASAVVAAIDALGSSSNSDQSTDQKICSQVVEKIYERIIIPLTKDVEVAYLFRRCGREPPPEYAPDRMSIDVVSLEDDA